MADNTNWFDVYNQTTANWIAMRDSEYRHEIDEKTLAQNEKLALAQLDLAEREYYSNIDIMNRNFGMQQQAFNYNKQQAELTRMREDNAFQRRVADTVKAGFSPLAAQGVANASQSPTLTAPQLDPQGVNQATSNRLNAYNSVMQNNNTKRQLHLQEQQLKLAQIETITETIAAVQNLRSQNIINQRNMHELGWYQEHGYRDTTMKSILSDILKGVNYKGKSIGQLGSDGINYALDKILNNSHNAKIFGTGNTSLLRASFANNVKKTGAFKKNNDKLQTYHLSDKERSSLFKNLSDARKGILSPIDIDKLNLKLQRYFNFDFGLTYGRWKSLTQKEYENILKQITERLR